MKDFISKFFLLDFNLSIILSIWINDKRKKISIITGEDSTCNTLKSILKITYILSKSFFFFFLGLTIVFFIKSFYIKIENLNIINYF